MFRRVARKLSPPSFLVEASSSFRWFSSAEGREPSQEAAFPNPVHLPTRILIDGELRKASNGRTFETINPGNEEVLAEVPESSEDDVNEAVQAASKALEGPWNKMAPRERGAALYRLADLIEANAEELAVLESLDNGKTIAQSRSVDIPASATMLRYFAGWADKLGGREIPIGPDHLCYTRMEPVGVVGAISPWNLPMIGIAAKVGPALACGNTVVYKPAEQTPLTSLRFAELAVEAHLPRGVLNILSGFGESTGAAIVAHPLVDKVSFTGSEAVGKHVQKTAADTLKRVTLELGGKNPSIVFGDADLELAVETVHNGLFWNKAEACASNTRIFVHESVFDEFVERAVARVREWHVGHPFDDSTCHGPLVSEEQFNKVSEYISIGKEEGAELLFGGNRVGTQGFYLEPAVFTNIKDDMRIFSEEIFGPVLTIASFSTMDEVIARANNSPYGLAAGVFSKDLATLHEATTRLKAGMVFNNAYHVVDVAAPFGGMKQSGYGREGGDEGIRAYTEVKNVVYYVGK